MNRMMRRRIAAGIIIVVVTVAGCFTYSFFFTWRQAQEAYAAWDTGTLLIEYMKSHNGQWPSSWGDLLTVMDSNSANQIRFRGSRAGDTNYAFALRQRVAINWKFDPRLGDQSSPVTRSDGSKFPVVWQGAEPNKMIHDYLRASAAANGQ